MSEEAVSLQSTAFQAAMCILVPNIQRIPTPTRFLINSTRFWLRQASGIKIHPSTTTSSESRKYREQFKQINSDRNIKTDSQKGGRGRRGAEIVL